MLSYPFTFLLQFFTELAFFLSIKIQKLILFQNEKLKMFVEDLKKEFYDVILHERVLILGIPFLKTHKTSISFYINYISFLTNTLLFKRKS